MLLQFSKKKEDKSHRSEPKLMGIGSHASQAD